MTRTDIHTHLIPPLDPTILATAGLGLESGMIIAAGRRIGPTALYRAEALRAWMTGAGIDRALVSIPPPLYRQGLDAADSEAWVRAVNDSLAAMVAGHDGLVPLGYLPLEHPQVALAELERLADERIGFVAAAGGGSRSLADPELRPLWGNVARHRRPVVLHPGAAPDPRLEEHYLGNLLGNPQESGLAAAQLLFGGVVAELPTLRVALVHCGGVLPAVIGRWQHGIDTARPGILRTSADLRAEAAQLWVDSLAHDNGVLDQPHG